MQLTVYYVFIYSYSCTLCSEATSAIYYIRIFTQEMMREIYNLIFLLAQFTSAQILRYLKSHRLLIHICLNISICFNILKSV